MQAFRLLMLCAMLLMSGSTSQAHEGAIYVQAGTLLLVPGEEAQTRKTLVIEEGRIKAVLDGYKKGKGHVIDLRDHFVMPGLMDMHVHIQGQLGPQNDSEQLRFSDAMIGMRSLMFAKRTLEAGFTTIRDLGSKAEEIYALREAVERGWVIAPRIIAAGGVAITGGHGDINGLRPDLLDHFTERTVCDGADDCRRATRHAIKHGADLVKISATGGVLSNTNTGTGQQMADEELVAVVEAAHNYGRKVAAHAHQADGINAALRAGVDSIEHGTFLNDESIRLFQETAAYFVPTLLAGETVVQMARRGGLGSDAIRRKALQVGPQSMKALSRAHKAGVRIAFGTDSGVSRHGINAQEAVLMAEAGMDEMAILVSATVSAAALIDHADRLGKLEKGYIADLIAMKKSPLDDIANLQQVDFVMAAGKVVKATKGHDHHHH